MSILSVVSRAISPLASIFILMLGAGFIPTILAVQLHQSHAHPLIIGAMTSAYYIGYVLASFRSEPFILRVGHIRAFATFASLLTVVTLFHPIWYQAVFWLLLRLVAGFCIAGLFIVIESWLLIMGTQKTRGQVLALYMVALYLAQSLGQFFLNLTTGAGWVLFGIAAMLTSLAVMPVAMTKISSPSFDEPKSLRFSELYAISPSGLFAALISGVMLGTIYGLLPVFLHTRTADTGDVALFMATTIFGGMALQYPVGRLSDLIDRRLVLIGVTLLTLLSALIMIVSFKITIIALIASFFFGGLTFTLYPLSISVTCDRIEQNCLVSATQALLLIYSLGAAIGPLIAPGFMSLFGADGFFIFIIVLCLIQIVFILWRKVAKESAPQEEPFISMPQTTAVSAELDPRQEETSH